MLEGDWTIRATLTERDAEEHRDIVRAGSVQVHVSANDIDDLKLRLAEPFDVEISADWGDSPPASPPQIIGPLTGIDGWLGNVGIISNPGEAEHDEIFAGRFLVGPSFLRTPGYYLAAAMMDGRDVLGQAVEIAAPAKIRMMFKTAGGSIRGTVEDGAGATVIALAEPTNAARFSWSAACDPSGRFTIPDLPPGEYTVLAYQELKDNGEGGVPELAAAPGERVKVEAGAVAPVNLRLN